MNPLPGESSLLWALIPYFETHPDYRPWLDPDLEYDQQALAGLYWSTWDLDRQIRAKQAGYAVDVDVASYAASSFALFAATGGSGQAFDRAAFGGWRKGVRESVFERDNYTCVYCGKKIPSGNGLTVDHVKSLKKSWSEGAAGWTPAQRNAWFNDPSGLATACSSCNSSKGSQSLVTWLLRTLGGGR